MIALLVGALAWAGDPSAATDHALTRPGSYHGDEVPWSSGDGWVGLYRTDDGYALRATALVVEPAHDPVLDDEGETSGRSVAATAGDGALFLFRGPDLSARKVDAVLDSSTFLYPGQTITGRSGDGWLDITAVATVTKAVEQPAGAVDFADFAIHFTARGSGQTRGTMVAPEARDWNDRQPVLLFVGDLDGDGHLDAVVDPSTHYNVSNPTLLLSGPAGPAGVLKIVANHLTVGC